MGPFDPVDTDADRDHAGTPVNRAGMAYVLVTTTHQETHIMGHQTPTLLPAEIDRLAGNTDTDAHPTACIRSPQRPARDHVDAPMVINFSRLMHITHATAVAGCSPR